MRLNRLKLVDWRNHVDTDIILDRLTVLRGSNAMGKSSVRSAIEFALTGRCDGTDEKGSGAARLIRDEAEKAVLLMKLQANKEVQLRCSLTEKSGRSLTIKDDADPTYTGEAVMQWLSSQRSVLSCLFDGHYFISLKPADQKALLAGIILPEAFPEEIMLTAAYDNPRLVQTATIKEKAANVHLSINWNLPAFDLIEAAYKLAFDRRRDINRDLKNLAIPDAIALPDGAGNLASVREKLSERRAKLTQIEDARYTAQKNQSKVESDIRVLDTRIESLQAKIRNESNTLALTEKSILSGKKLKDTQKIADGRKKLDQIESDLQRFRESKAGVEAILARFDALDGKNACPGCGREVTDDWLVAAMQPHVDKKNSLEQQQLDLLDAEKALGDVQGAESDLAAHERALQNQKRSQEIISETNSLLNTAQNELEGLKNRLAALPKSDQAGEDTQALRSEIAMLEAQIEKVAVAEARAKEIERAKDQHKKLAQASGTLDEFVTYFGKDGVKADLLKQHIGGFTSAMNSALAGWGYACSFEIEPYGFKVINLTRKTERAIELLSTSEKLRFSVAFQVALAQVSGIRMVIVDEADLLDSAGRNALYPLLLDADLDQAIVIGTDEREEVPEVEGAVFYALRDGHALQLQPVEV